MKSATEAAAIVNVVDPDVLQDVDWNNVRRVSVEEKDVVFAVTWSAFDDLHLKFLNGAQVMCTSMKHDSVAAYHGTGGSGLHTHAA